MFCQCPPHAVPGCAVPSAPTPPAAPPCGWGASCAATPPAEEPPGNGTCPLAAAFSPEGAGRASFQSCCRTRGSTLLFAARLRCFLALLPACVAAAGAARVRCTPLASRACSTVSLPVRQQRCACKKKGYTPHEPGANSYKFKPGIRERPASPMPHLPELLRLRLVVLLA